MELPRTGVERRPEAYAGAIREFTQLFGSDRVIRDPLRLLAYGTDASFYRLIPQVVVKVESEAEAASVLAAAAATGLPVTFRAAGTSLSGQAVSDSVLMMLGDKWDRVDVQKAGALIRLQPGVIGGGCQPAAGELCA